VWHHVRVNDNVAALMPLLAAPNPLETLHLELREDIVILTLSGPDGANAMSAQMLTELAQATRVLAGCEALAGLVITGAGRTFSIGADPRFYQQAITDDTIDIQEYADSFTSALAEAILNIQDIGCPVIAAVNGQAAGAGFSLALACDYRVAAPKAAFDFAYGRIGASTDGGMTWFLPRIVGASRALQLLIEQPVLRAQRALAEGILQEVVGADELIDACLTRLKMLDSVAPHAIRSAKRLIRTSFQLSVEEHLEMERSAFAAGLVTRDMRHGVEAFLSGDWPQFKGC
jgi:enoyl-CoA hydratase/carnithine racemase